MTKSTITRERIQRIIRAINSEAYDEEEIREWLSSDEIMELSRIALAVMDSEPVAWTDEQELRDVDRGGCGYLFTVNPVTPHADERRIILLYRHAQPAPVVNGEYGDAYRGAREDLAIWKRRALEAEESVSRLEQINDHLVKEAQGESRMGEPVIAQPVPVVPNEIKHRIGGLDWGWEGEFNRGWNACRAAMLQELKKSAGTEAICRSDENVQVLHTKSPAQSDCCPAQNHVSPEQNGDTPAQSQGWIQVSEQMPPSRHEVLVGRWWGEKPRWCCKWATYIPGHPDAQSSGWLIPGASWTPTHWMPLPASPQEVR
ncbi:DUF551 domain-containing protein [Klebsiella pneumoniae]|nr:DUF551 domain-containing protein [Klebsiella pneumoniae]